MTVETNAKIQAQIVSIVENCSTMDDAKRAGIVIDNYQVNQPKEKEFIQDVRDLLCDITFRIYDSTNKK